jgi:hypothetical protein
MTPEISSDVGSTAIALAVLSNGCEMYSDAHTGFGHPAGCQFDATSRLDVTNEVILRNVTVPDGGAFADSVENTFTATPEPSVWALVGAGLAALGLLRRRRRTMTQSVKKVLTPMTQCVINGDEPPDGPHH